MADNRITLELSNAELEGTPIRVADLVTGLGAVRRALLRTDDMVKSSLAEPMDWRIVHLSYASPVRVIVEPIPLPGYERHSELVVSRFFDYAERIRSGFYDDVDARVMRAFMDLAKPVERGRLNLDIRNGSVGFTVPLGMSHGIKAALAPETTALGSVKGRLEFINLHGGKMDLRGIAPDATGHLSSEDFVRGVCPTRLDQGRKAQRWADGEPA